jgi:hypothetical protein
MLPYLRPDSTRAVELQDSEFTTDVLGRYVCSTLDEAINNGGRPFDVVIVGAGMFGAYLAEKLYRQGTDQGLRILVLDAGGYTLPTHAQNLPHLGLNPPDTALVMRNEQDPGPRVGVWGIPWHSNEPFTGLAYTPAGRSLFWGGWAPKLTDADLAAWPKEARDFLAANYPDIEDEIGVKKKADYLSGPLNTQLKSSLKAAVSGKAPVSPGITVDLVDDAPLAVQASAPGPGLFPFDKYSSAPLLLEAVRDDINRRWTFNDNSRRRLFLVPRAHVIRLQQSGDVVSGIELAYNGQRTFLSSPWNLSSECQVIMAAGTIESTRLALESFPVPRREFSMGANFMAHLRTNLTVRVKRSALGLAASTTLEQGGAIIRGEITNLDGSRRRYHLQVLASAEKGTNPEATMWAMVPDIDLLRNLLVNQSPDWVTIVFRGLGEMSGDRLSGAGSVTSFIDLTNGSDPSQVDEFGARRAWVHFAATDNDTAAWKLLARAAVDIAARLGKPADVQYLYNGIWNDTPPADPFLATKDQLGNTHHEAGTLWMGDDPAKSITDAAGKFHHVTNTYVAGPALFPTVGSANPSLTGLTLARRTASAVTAALTPKPVAAFKPLYTGTLTDWQMAGFGRFLQVFDILESTDGPGLLWYTREIFSDFVLEVEWQYADRADNSGIFIRIPTLNSSNPQNDWLTAVDQGYEIQIDPRGFNAEKNIENDPLRSTGAIYNLNAPTRTDVARGPWQWNTVVIEAIANRIKVTLNDVVVNDFVDPTRRASRGHVALQNHHRGSKVQFRNIRIQSILPAVVALPTGRRRTAA